MTGNADALWEEAMRDTLERRDIVTRARAAGIDLQYEDFGPDNTLDGMDPHEWLDAMTEEGE